MRTSEAQVLIVDDDSYKAADLQRMIEAGGGTVVGCINEYETAIDVLGDPSFPTDPSQRNVVLLDGTMRRDMGSDGSRLFMLGRRKGWLHGVSEHAPGVLAVSCSSDRYSEISHDTGATVVDSEPYGWSNIVDGHPSVPKFAPDDAIEREILEGMDIPLALQIALGGQAVTRLAVLRLSSPRQEGREPKVLELADPELTALASPQLLMQVMSGHGGPKSARKFTKQPTYSATAVMTTETGLVVISRHQRPNPHSREYFAESTLTDCAFDRMPLETLDQIPLLYWSDHQLDPATF